MHKSEQSSSAADGFRQWFSDEMTGTNAFFCLGFKNKKHTRRDEFLAPSIRVVGSVHSFWSPGQATVTDRAF
jgi:hypothetical protein